MNIATQTLILQSRMKALRRGTAIVRCLLSSCVDSFHIRLDRFRIDKTRITPLRSDKKTKLISMTVFNSDAAKTNLTNNAEKNFIQWFRNNKMRPRCPCSTRSIIIVVVGGLNETLPPLRLFSSTNGDLPGSIDLTIRLRLLEFFVLTIVDLERGAKRRVSPRRSSFSLYHSIDRTETVQRSQNCR